MSIPWILLQWRALERRSAEAARSRVHAAGVGAGAVASKEGGRIWSRVLDTLDRAIRRLSR